MQFVVNLLLKLQERVPVQYALVRNSSSIDPSNMAIQAAPMSKRFVSSVLLLLIMPSVILPVYKDRSGQRERLIPFICHKETASGCILA